MFRNVRTTLAALVLLAAFSPATTASAQGTLPAPRSDHDARPPVAHPQGTGGAGLTEQAGIGGTQAYGRPGVLELGGSFGINTATDYRAISVTPSIGWFVANNLELSVLLSINSIKAGNESSTVLSALFEPSYHLPLNNAMFLFGGVGFGGQYAKSPGAGLAVAPRVGMNLMVGRSGVFTPSFGLIYCNTDAVQTSQGTLLAVSVTYGLNAGYTVLW